MSGVPSDQLAEAVKATVGVNTLDALVMNTFAFEWSFVLDEVLPLFLPGAASAGAYAAREDLADRLLERKVPITVYYDAGHTRDWTGPSRVPLSTVPVQHRGGVFHPKVILALVSNEVGQHLIVVVGSANLTKAAWWEWLECAQVVTIDEGERTWMKDDLTNFVKYLLTQRGHPGTKLAASAVAAFLAGTEQAKLRTDPGQGIVHFVWNGTGSTPSLTDAIAAKVQPWSRGGLLEVMSPWFSDTGDVVLRSLMDATGVKEAVVAVPRDPNGAAELPPDAVDRLPDTVNWGDLPGVLRSGGPGVDVADRHLHAKAYRFTRPRDHGQYVIVGSFNLTEQAFHAHHNVEAALISDLPDGGRQRWLTVVEDPVTFAADVRDVEAETFPATQLADLTVSYDWASGIGAISRRGPENAGFDLTLSRGNLEVLALGAQQWPGDLTAEHSQALRDHLASGSPLLDAGTVQGEGLGYVVVTELNVARKPCLDSARNLADSVADLLLDDEARRGRRQAEHPGADDPDVDGTPVEPPEGAPQEKAEDLFDGIAALYQALASFDRHLADLADDVAAIDYRISGEGPRCLGDLLTQAEKTADNDPVMALIVCWGIEDVLTQSKRQLTGHRAAVQAITTRVDNLRAQVQEVLTARNSDADPAFGRFLAWSRRTFVRGLS